MNAAEPGSSPADATDPSPFRHGLRDGFMLGPAVFVFGASFGVLAGPAGIGTVAALVMSGTTFAGSAQFAAVSALGRNGGAFTASVAAIVLNTRYLPISISVAPAMGGPWWRRVAEAQLITDESWALSRQPDGRYDRNLLLGAGLALWIIWMAGTAAGSLGARYVGDPNRLGLDVAFPALFVALLAGQSWRPREVTAAVLGSVVVLALAPVTSSGVAVTASVMACLIGLAPTRNAGEPAVSAP
ncbi:MAG: AzlC family ABC transporter permease [Frankia sp.]